MKKMLKWLMIIFIGLVVVSAIGAANGSSTASQPVGDTIVGSTTDQTSQPTSVPEATATSVPVLKVGIGTLFSQYDGNKLTADAYYKGRIIQVQGVASNISQDIMGNYFVALNSGPDNFTMDQVQCFVSDPNQLASLTNGHFVTVQGRVDDMSLGIIPLKDCQVVS